MIKPCLIIAEQNLRRYLFLYPNDDGMEGQQIGNMMSKNLTIRVAQPSDINLLIEIWLASVRATHTFLSEEEIQELLPLVKEQALPALELWVLLAGEDIIGFAGLSDNNLEALFLHPEHLGKGGGKMLVNHARQLKGSLVVDVNEQNPEAVKFYKSVGFEIVGRSETDAGGRPYPILHMREINPKE